MKPTKAWAIVTPRGRVIDKMTYSSKSDATMNMTDYDERHGCKVRRVYIICEAR